MPRLIIATPVAGGPNAGTVSVQHALSLAALLRDPAIGVVPTVLMSNTDLVRARSRAVKFALEDGADHLLFWDSDVGGSPERVGQCLQGMIAANVDVIAAPYPKRQLPVEYPLRQRGQVEITNGVCEVEAVAMGFTLLSRWCMLTMATMYADDLSFDDNEPGGAPPGPCVAMFQLMIHKRQLLSEDYSFCQRWRDLDERMHGRHRPGKIHMYTGPGAPLDHVGAYVFEGSRETLFRKPA